MSKPCKDCEGTGLTECPYCGTEESYDCDACEGTGVVDEDDEDEEEIDPCGCTG